MLNKKDEQEKDNQVEAEDFYGNDPFTFDDIKNYWLEFASKKKAEGKDSEYMVLMQEISLKNDSSIVIKMTNTVNLDILDRFRSDLITFLKSKLKNGSISLETELAKEDTKRMIYTNKDKFDYLAEKKPILNQLRERLGLDPDF